MAVDVFARLEAAVGITLATVALTWELSALGSSGRRVKLRAELTIVGTYDGPVECLAVTVRNPSRNGTVISRVGVRLADGAAYYPQGLKTEAFAAPVDECLIEPRSHMVWYFALSHFEQLADEHRHELAVRPFVRLVSGREVSTKRAVAIASRSGFRQP